MLRYAPFHGPEIFWVIPSHSRFSEAPCGQCNRPLRYWILVHCILSDGIWSWFLWRNILKARVVGCFWSRSLPFLPLWLWLFVSFCFWAALFWVQLWMVSGFNLSDPWSLRCPSCAARYFAVASSSCAARFLPTPLPCPKLEQQHPGMRSPADPQHGMENQQGAATRQRVCDRARYAWRWLPTHHANIYIYTHMIIIYAFIYYTEYILIPMKNGSFQRQPAMRTNLNWVPLPPAQVVSIITYGWFILGICGFRFRHIFWRFAASHWGCPKEIYTLCNRLCT